MIVRTNRITGPGRGDRGQTLLAAALTIGGLTVALILGLLSDGFYHDDDACHYLYARDAWTNTIALLGQWSRPGYNLPTAVVARWFGMAGCRAFSALQTAGVAWLAFLIARRIAGGGRERSWWPALAPALVWAQPMTMTLALTTLTETPAALYLAMGVWLHLRGNRVWACAAFSMLFVTRYETMALAPIVAGAVAFDAAARARWKLGAALKRPWLWGCVAAMAWAPLTYVAAAHVAGVAPADSPLYMFDRAYTTEYASGPLHHFLSVWPQAAGLGVLACAAGGAIYLRGRAWLPAALTAGLVALHSWLYWRGSFATGGYARFLVPVSAPVAVLAAGGIHGAWRAAGRFVPAALPATAAALAGLVILSWPVVIARELSVAPARLAVAVAAVLVTIAGGVLIAPANLRRWSGRILAAAAIGLIAVQIGFQVRPLSLDASKEHYTISRAVKAIAQSEYRDRPAITQHVLVRFLRPNTRGIGGNRQAIAAWRNAEPGTLFFWENKYCYKPRDMESTNLLWRQMRRLGRLVHKSEHMTAVAMVFERRRDTHSRSSTEVAATGPAGP